MARFWGFGALEFRGVGVLSFVFVYPFGINNHSVFYPSSSRFSVGDTVVRLSLDFTRAGTCRVSGLPFEINNLRKRGSLTQGDPLEV